MKSCGANNIDVLGTPWVSICVTASAFVDPVFGLFFTDGTYRSIVMRTPLKAVAFYPNCGLGVPYGLHQNMWHDGRCC